MLEQNKNQLILTSKPATKLHQMALTKMVQPKKLISKITSPTNQHLEEVAKYPYGDGGEMPRPIQKTEQLTPTVFQVPS